MQSNYERDRHTIGKYDVLLNYEEVVIMDAETREVRLNPGQALALLTWLEQHRGELEQADATETAKSATLDDI